MRWALVSAMVGATVASDLLQSWAGKRQGAVTSLGRLSALIRQWPIVLAIVCMAISFFSLLELLKIEDLSFAVPVSAATIVLETLLARVLLSEPVGARRWMGTALVAAGVFLLARS
ncbi:MAG: EamA family transporter [Acidobacteriota bacterium]